jgi:hypothetical protein
MKKILKVAGSMLVGVALLGSGCVAYGPGPDGYYSYDYYPDADVYFYPVGGYYYWNNGGHWYHGKNLPAQYTINVQSRQSLQLHTSRPWTEYHAPSGAVHSSGGGGNGHDWQH